MHNGQFRELESIHLSSSLPFPSLESSTIFAYLPQVEYLSIEVWFGVLLQNLSTFCVCSRLPEYAI